VWTCAFFACAATLSLGYAVAASQEPAPADQPKQQQTGATAPATSSSKGGKEKYSHADDFLIRGTVFTDKALAFAGAELRVRRAGDKKYRVHDLTNSRGEFAIRVPQGFEYEMQVHAKGFTDEMQTVDARNGAGANNLVFRMKRSEREKK
jgi:hypothetical protein